MESSFWAACFVNKKHSAYVVQCFRGSQLTATEGEMRRRVFNGCASIGVKVERKW